MAHWIIYKPINTTNTMILSCTFTLLQSFFTKEWFKGTNQFLTELNLFSKQFVMAFKKKPLLILSFLIHDILVWSGIRSLTYKGFYHVWSKPTILMTTNAQWLLIILELGYIFIKYLFIFSLSPYIRYDPTHLKRDNSFIPYLPSLACFMLGRG